MQHEPGIERKRSTASEVSELARSLASEKIPEEDADSPISTPTMDKKRYSTSSTQVGVVTLL